MKFATVFSFICIFENDFFKKKVKNSATTSTARKNEHYDFVV